MVVLDQVGQLLGWPLVPPFKRPEAFVPWSPPGLISALTADYESWNLVWRSALEKLPVAIPFALATIVGGIDCTESAAAAGDEYDTRTILLTEGVASVVAGCLGGVIQTTPYIGHPAYKTMGGRAAYTLATALFVGAAGYFGWFTQLFDWLPKAAMFPILVFVGLEITAQSFRATPVRHYAALALAMLPALAALVDISLNNAAGPAVREEAKVIALTVRCLSHGFIVTSLLWAALLASILDRQLGWSAIYSVAASLCALFGIIHSPLDGAPIDLPNRVYRQLAQEVQNMSPPPQSPASFLCQSPYHWAGAYALTAAVLVGLALFRPRHDKVTG
jgi:AGZA family xanthine/uracil permease-like MFS transporter